MLDTKPTGGAEGIRNALTASYLERLVGENPVLPFLAFSVLPRKNLKVTKDFLLLPNPQNPSKRQKIPKQPRKFLALIRAKGTLISEPRFYTPCEMRSFTREKGKKAFSKKNPRQRPFSLSHVGKIASRRGWKIGAH